MALTVVSASLTLGQAAGTQGGRRPARGRKRNQVVCAMRGTLREQQDAWLTLVTHLVATRNKYLLAQLARWPRQIEAVQWFRCAIDCSVSCACLRGSMVACTITSSGCKSCSSAQPCVHHRYLQAFCHTWVLRKTGPTSTARIRGGTHSALRCSAHNPPVYPRISRPVGINSSLCALPAMSQQSKGHQGTRQECCRPISRRLKGRAGYHMEAYPSPQPGFAGALQDRGV